MRSSGGRIDAYQLTSLLVSPLRLSFLDGYNLYMSSLEFKALCIVHNFVILWSVVDLKDIPEYLKKRTAQNEISAAELRFEKHSRYSEVPFS